jgi:hypothetical protein
MNQDIHNENNVDTQLNIAVNEGNVYYRQPTRWSQRFAKLKKEVEGKVMYGEFIEALITYNTKLDGKNTEEKLQDGNFSEREIFEAIKRKDRYAKRLEKNKNFETAQLIDTEIFALMKMNFETYVTPLISENQSKTQIKQAVVEKVIEPVLKILNEEGADDNYLGYTADDILGMLYFLTGKCHINWADYDNL